MTYAISPDGTRIYYEQHGSGPAVVLVHGSGGHHASWWQQVCWLRDRYTVVTLDLRGFGRSHTDIAGFDAAALPDDIAAVVSAAQLQRAVLVGQSIGGAAVLRAALRAPQRVTGVVLAQSIGAISDPDLSARVRGDRERAERLPLLDRLLTPEFRRDRPDFTFLFQQMGTFNAAGIAQLRPLGADGPTVPEVIDSGIPMCFLAGDSDPALSPQTVQAAAERVTGAMLELVPGGPHAMYWENPELFNPALERFLCRVYSTVATGAQQQ
ncbi:alpha/beta fold hydrolase [Actinoplanes subtropicus]|uniref:alpha/beta fold hydrolase n=1 Tax=Actinoplanes subtropicus TaxID=543632 RepID=UPI0004C3A4EB|nr:alpha/beta hydrolase [Actinoplanes subtropicus]